MVAGMQPFERMRALARWSGHDGRTLASEAADCLAGFADDPAGLVVASRRLLVHRPTSAPLWWLCSRVVCAPDPAEAAWESWKRLVEDPTPGRLAALLPFPHDDVVAVLGWPEQTAEAIETRPDLDAVAVRRSDDHHMAADMRRSDAVVRAVSEVELLALEPSHLIVEVLGAGNGQALVPYGTAEILESIRLDGREDCALWFVAGVGRVLPDRLFDAMVGHIGGADRLPAHDLELLPLDTAVRIAGPTGLSDPATLAGRADCPVAPELLRLGDSSY
ncbi:MAG: hypothetical protein JWL73_120 [Actinomycetia bacterium]|nr:hypothetical protein [Actinomycetes bacterium]